MAKGNYQIPFDKNGNQMSYGDEWFSPTWKDNYEFKDRLEYYGYGRGRSSITMDFKSTTDGKRYSMFISDFDDIVCDLENGIIEGKFTFVKKGRNFGLKRIED